MSRKSPVPALLLIGPTGAGKTPLGSHIEKQGLSGRRCHHFDFGRELRAVGGSQVPPVGFNAPEYLFIRDVLDKGLLLEDQHFPIAAKILTQFLSSRGFMEQDLLVLNGLPRHIGQACAIEAHADVKGVVVLECAAEDVHARLRSDIGGDRAERSDDGIELVRCKLETFRERTLPLLEHYAHRGRPQHRLRVTAKTTVSDAYRELLTLFVKGAE